MSLTPNFDSKSYLLRGNINDGKLTHKSWTYHLSTTMDEIVRVTSLSPSPVFPLFFLVSRMKVTEQFRKFMRRAAERTRAGIGHDYEVS